MLGMLYILYWPFHLIEVYSRYGRTLWRKPNQLDAREKFNTNSQLQSLHVPGVQLHIHLRS